jgi:PEP-CTERM motif
MVSENNLLGSNLFWNGLIGGTQGSGATTTFNAWVSPGNTLFATTTPLCNVGPGSAMAVALSCASSVPFSGNPFSLTESITINAPAGSLVASGDASLTAATPEPSALALMSLGLVGIGGIYRRKVNI